MRPGRDNGAVAAPASRRPRRRSGPGDAPRPRESARREPRERRSSAPASKPAAHPADRPSRPKTTGQAQARSKARKAKAPKVVRPPLRQRLRQRLLDRLSGLDLRPQALLSRIPFVVVVIGSLGLGLGITLWLSTDAAQRSYQLGNARALNEALAQQKEALEREVLQAESAPALAEAARELGMIPSKNTAHLVLDPAGNWVVVGQPKPAEGAPPPPLNTKLPDEQPPAAPAPPPPATLPPGAAVEVPVRLAPASPWPGGVPGSSPLVGTAGVPEVPVRMPATAGPLTQHSGVAVLPGPAPLPGPVLMPEQAPVSAPLPGPAPVPEPAPVPGPVLMPEQAPMAEPPPPVLPVPPNPGGVQ